MKKYKVGFVLDDTLDKPDGVQQHVLTVGKWLSEQGHEVHYLVANSERKDLENVHSLGKFANFRFNKNNVRTPLPTTNRKIKKSPFKRGFFFVNFFNFVISSVVRNLLSP